MSDKPQGKDGFIRVLARFKQEFKIWRRAVKPHLERLKNPLDGHAFVNLWVEGCRVTEAAYFNGHVIAWSFYFHLVQFAVIGWLTNEVWGWFPYTF